MLSVKGWVGNKKYEEKVDQVDGDHEEIAGEERSKPPLKGARSFLVLMLYKGQEKMPRSLRVEELVKGDSIWYILRHEGVGPLLSAYGGCGAMAGVDHRFLGEGEEFSSYALYEGLEIASGKVGAADAHVEEGVSGEDDTLAQEGDATRGMARGMEDFQTDLAEPHFVSLLEEDIRRRAWGDSQE